MEVLYSASRSAADKPKSSAKSLRHIPSAPTRILDAPDLLDDYYLNLVSWSSENIIAVALGPAVYLWNAKTGTIEELMALEDESDYVCSLEWIPGGTHLAVGTASAATQLWDATALKQVRSMDGHSDRISSMAWNNHILSTGSKDTTIVHHDVRIQSHQVGTLKGHTQEVCGLKWSPEGHALASGGNDNLLCIWDAAAAGQRSNVVQQPKFSLGEHCAAVKALAWSPHERNLVASGGGTADRCIKFWNTQTGSMLNSIDTGSQVCSLLWNPHEKEILSSHGFSKNELCLWKYPSMCKVKELTGHTARVLHMATSPNGSSVVSAGADETLRFWDVFGDAPEAKKAKSGLSAGGSFNSTMQIR
jgi:cell division cycle 20, cofactor of APC complex